MKTNLLKFVLLVLAAVTLTVCSKKEEAASTPDIFAGTFDSTVSAGDDFFKYAFGTWIKNNPIPPAESAWGISREVKNEVYKRLFKICQDAASSPGDNKSAQTIGALWAAGMDSLAIENEKLSALLPYIERLNNIKSKQELFTAVAELQSMRVMPLFNTRVGQDDKNSGQYAFFLHQGGLGLPSREYYFSDDVASAKIRDQYLAHISKMFSLIGRTDAPQSSKAIVDFETSLAKASRKLEALRDPYKNYNKYAVADLPKKFKAIDWGKLLGGMNVRVDSIIVGQPEFVSEVGVLTKTESLQTWKDYLTWALLRDYAPRLHHALAIENFNFYDVALVGVKERKPRWKRILDHEEAYVGELLGQEFVKNYFTQETKQRYSKLVDEMLVTFREHIEALDWMTDSTKQKAVLKLSTIQKKIGYPDKWKDYSSLSFTRGSFVKNCIAGEKWLYQFDNNKLGKPVDREEWMMTPQAYNAYYNPYSNEIALTAAVFMVPGFNDQDLDDAIVYGYGAASTIGHELTHAFDDQGSQYDEKGNLRNWWTKKDNEQFKRKVKGIVNHFNNFVVLDSMHINGEATAGENIADLGGITIALDAFKKTAQYKEGKLVNGLTPVQRFFLGYALAWKVITTDELLLLMVQSDVHSPPFVRINGPFSLVPEFYEAFNVQPGQPMWRADSVRVKIW